MMSPDVLGILNINQRVLANMRRFTILLLFCLYYIFLNITPLYAELSPEKGMEADLSGLIYAARCMEEAGYKFDPAFQKKFFKDEIVKFSERLAMEIIKNAQDNAANMLETYGLDLCPLILKNQSDKASKAGLDSSAIEYAMEKYK